MPIRFRCPRCTRLLGIASRKAGTQTTCPQCGNTITVPLKDEPDDFAELEALLNPGGGGGTRSATSAKRPPATPKPSAPKPPPARRREPGDEPLFHTDDVDALLGIGGSAKATARDLEREDKPRPVSGVDALSLEDPPANLVLTPQKATLLVVIVVVLIGLAFTAGFLVGSSH